MENPDLHELSRELRRRRQPHAWITVVAVQNPSSAYVGAQAIVEADGEMHGWVGGGCVQGAARSAALRALASATPRRLRLSNSGDSSDTIDVRPMACASGGEVELFIQPAAIAPRLRIYGATPVARAAAWLARQAEFDPLTDAEAEDAAALEASLATAGAAPSPPPTPRRESYALVATQGDGDEEALENALRSDARAVLLVASRRKADRLRTVMASRDLPAERLAVIHAPAGPDIGAITPNEIALAAVAGLIALRRGHDPSVNSQASAAGGASTAPSSRQTHPEANQVGYVNPVCGAVVDPETALSSISCEGQTHYFCCHGCRAEFQRNPQKYLQIAAHMNERPQESIR